MKITTIILVLIILSGTVFAEQSATIVTGTQESQNTIGVQDIVEGSGSSQGQSTITVEDISGGIETRVGGSSTPIVVPPVTPVFETQEKESTQIVVPSITKEVMIEYNELLIDLKEAEYKEDVESTELITKEIIDLRSKIKGETVSVTQEPIVMEIEKPVSGSSSSEIKVYYQGKIEEITSKTEEVQIEELKELREEIDILVEDLMVSKDRIETKEVDDLVSKVEIMPGEIKADNIQIKTIGKMIITTLDEKEISIEPQEKEVLIKDGNIEVKAEQITLEDGKIKIGTSFVETTPSEALTLIDITAEHIELKEEKGKAVYKVQGKEKRKLIGIFPIDVNKEITIDADTISIISEESPWYVFLTTK